MADRINDGSAKLLEQLAKKAGVTLFECDPKWGGRFGYRMADNLYVSVCGFRTEGAAYKHWIESALGEKATKALLDLLRKASAHA